jgi:hypothetical protein
MAEVEISLGNDTYPFVLKREYPAKNHGNRFSLTDEKLIFDGAMYRVNV